MIRRLIILLLIVGCVFSESKSTIITNKGNTVEYVFRSYKPQQDQFLSKEKREKIQRQLNENILRLNIDQQLLRANAHALFEWPLSLNDESNDYGDCECQIVGVVSADCSGECGGSAVLDECGGDGLSCGVISFDTDSTLDIITWNIENFPKKDNETVDYVDNLITSSNIDIIALQEISDDGYFTQLINELNDPESQDNWVGYRSGTGSWGELAYIINTSTIDIIQSPYTILNSFSHYFAYREPYILEITFSNDQIFIINNHFKCCGNGIIQNDYWDEEYRRQQASIYLKNYIDTYLADENVIVLGDLNDELTDPEGNNVFWNFISNPNEYMFVDMDIAKGSPDNWSYPTWPSHIDHILITNELFDNVVSVNTVLYDKVLTEGWFEYDYFISDHRPVGIQLLFYETSSVEGCTDPEACNYDETATADDGSCEYPEENYDCDGICVNDTDADGICDELEVLGCTVETACNYNADATDDDGSCILAESGYDCEGSDDCYCQSGCECCDDDCWCWECDNTNECTPDVDLDCGGCCYTSDGKNYCSNYSQSACDARDGTMICKGPGCGCLSCEDKSIQEGWGDNDACGAVGNIPTNEDGIGYCTETVINGEISLDCGCNYHDNCITDTDGVNICDDVDDCVVEDGASQECGCNTGIAEGSCDCDGNGPAEGFGCDGEPLSLFNGLIPEDFSIHSIYPNPFNPVTSITYGLPEHINVQIIVYDLSGKQIETLINQFQTPGYHSVNWNADNLPSGVYLIRMDSGDFTQTQKVVLVK